MADLHISFDEYRKKTEQLASQIYKDGWSFNQVVCIAKGGMRVGDIMARIFDVPLAILSVESYRGEGVKFICLCNVESEDLSWLCSTISN